MLFIYSDNKVFYELSIIIKNILLNKYGINVPIINEITKYSNNKDNDLYIIFGMNDYNSNIVPKNYIVYQLEQTTGNSSSKWFNDRYMKFLKGAIEVWDYSYTNYLWIQNMLYNINDTNDKKNIKDIKNNLVYKPIGYVDDNIFNINISNININISNIINDKIYDILFIGSLNERRNIILDKLKKLDFKVQICTNSYDNELYDYMSKSRIIINIHYYEESILEVVRLSSILNKKINNNNYINPIIISEFSNDTLLDSEYSKYINMCNYNELINECIRIKENSFKEEKDYIKFKNYSYINNFNDFNKFEYFYSTNEKVNFNNKLLKNLETISNNDIPKILTDQEINNIIDKFDKTDKSDKVELPYISLVTITYNRKSLFKLPIRNYLDTTYPKNKIEWIIVDDSTDYETLSDILPKDNNIMYHKLKTTGRLSIGQKRNYAIEHCSSEYIVFMDDDDYYFNDSITNRIKTLIMNPKYDLVGVKKLYIHDMNSDSSFIVNSEYISEASMAFRKVLYKDKKFPESHSTLGEGYVFCKNRYSKCICIPSKYVLISITHGKNYTGDIRSGSSDVNILDNIESNKKMFIYKTFGKFLEKD